MVKPTRYFVFVEFTDERVVRLLKNLRRHFEQRASVEQPHVTVQGPFIAQPEGEKLERLSDALRGYGVLISGVGDFKTPKGHAIYLKAQSPVFDDIWWKPDFQGPGFKKIPHITIFESDDEKRAQVVRKFLKSEKIEIFTLGLKVRLYESRQLTLFEEDYLNVQPIVRRKLERWSVKPDILERAASLNRD